MRKLTVIIGWTAVVALSAGLVTASLPGSTSASPRAVSVVRAERPEPIDEKASYQLASPDGDRCVEVRPGSTASRALAQAGTCDGSGSQVFQFVRAGHGYYYIAAGLAPRPVLDVTDWSVADGASVQLFRYAGGHNQQWEPVAEDGGTYHFVARHSRLCLAATAGAARLGQHACDDSLAQSFALVR